ncbi:GNAT family N-acetyltransferase [Kurthia gibsonii]|uniref:GNAT family N-acetyltransferase n=1 Tax=Kurthia gibsonii TaxID=33946 RepID=UPI0031B73925
MNVFAMKATYPLDTLTQQELTQLCEDAALTDGVNYLEWMHEQDWNEWDTRGFFVFIYDEDHDRLVAALSAFDAFGLHAYEWTMVIEPSYRSIGLEEVLIDGLKHGLEERQATGEMAVVNQRQEMKQVLEQQGYVYSSSKLQMMTTAQQENDVEFNVRPYQPDDLQVVQQMMSDGFGDLPEETEEFIALMDEESSSHVFVATQQDEVVAMVTTAVLERQLWITSFTTLASKRRQGIASNLVKWVKNEAYRQQLESVRLEVETENIEALTFYKQAGFEVVEQVDYYIVK